MTDPARDWTLLVHRHLDGSLDDEEARALNARLESDPELRRLLARMAFDQAQFGGLLGERREAARPRAWSRGSLAAAASILIAVAVALFIGLRPAPPSDAPAAPKEASGEFRGPVTGRVVKRGDAPQVTFAVSAPAGLAGRVLTVVPGRTRNGDGEEQVDRDHLTFLRKMPADRDVTLDLRRLESGDYAVVALSAEQIELLNQKPEKKKADKTERKPDPGKPPVREGDRPRDK